MRRILSADIVREGREAIHAWYTGTKEAIAASFEGAPERGPRIVCVGGAPGAGKSTYLQGIDLQENVVCIEAVFAQRWQRRQIITIVRDIAAGRPYAAHFVWLDTPILTCLQRNHGRDEANKVPEQAIIRAHEFFRAQPPHLDEGWASITRKGDPSHE